MLALEKWRHELCQQVRKHLIENANAAFRPRERNSNQFVFDGAGDLHAFALLQPHRHADRIIRFFLKQMSNAEDFSAFFF